MPTTPVAIFDVDAHLLTAIESALGPPIDSYLRGWQTWIEPVDDPDAPEDIELEFRLHPPGGFAQPAGLDHHDLWDEVTRQLAEGAAEFELGTERRTLDSLWVLLEVYPAFGHEVAAADVARWAEARIGHPSRAHGDVDHARLGGRFKRQGPEFDVAAELVQALG